jgi:hypothetical protein
MARKQLYLKYERVIYTDTPGTICEALILSRPRTGNVYVILPIENLVTGEKYLHPQEVMVYPSTLKPYSLRSKV